jgi:hypothetical protein
MGRKADGASVRFKLVAIRLNAEEELELERMKRARGIDQNSEYLRTLMREDSQRHA